MTGWYLVHAQGRRERIAEVNLAQQGYTCFLPLERRTVRHARKRQVVKAAYFPGYLFVELDLERQAWRPINSTVGVLRLVVTRNTPQPVPQPVIDGLRTLADEEGVLDLSRNLQPGDPVRVTLGPFADQIGQVAALRGTDRVQVLLGIMQQTVTVECDRGDLARV